MKLIATLITVVLVLVLLYIAYRTYYRLSPEQNAMASKMREVCEAKGFKHDGSFVSSVGFNIEEEDTDKEARDKGIEFACKNYFSAQCKDAYFGWCYRNRTEDETKIKIERECNNNTNMSIPNNGYKRPYEQAREAINEICKDVNN